MVIISSLLDRLDLMSAGSTDICSEVVQTAQESEIMKTPPELERKMREITNEFMNEGEDLLLNQLPKEILRLTEEIDVTI